MKRSLRLLVVYRLGGLMAVSPDIVMLREEMDAAMVPVRGLTMGGEDTAGMPVLQNGVVGGRREMWLAA
jgi:hypothetical protein